MIIDVKGRSCSERGFKIGTHNGVFHTDEVVGMAILDIVYEDEGVHVVRTRDKEELGKCDLVIDVGGGNLDHHIAGFDLGRETGEMTSSLFLWTWKITEKKQELTFLALYRSLFQRLLTRILITMRRFSKLNRWHAVFFAS